LQKHRKQGVSEDKYHTTSARNLKIDPKVQSSYKDKTKSEHPERTGCRACDRATAIFLRHAMHGKTSEASWGHENFDVSASQQGKQATCFGDPVGPKDYAVETVENGSKVNALCSSEVWYTASKVLYNKFRFLSQQQETGAWTQTSSP
jgi:hypothetical protein